jgi:hypothetical protein
MPCSSNSNTRTEETGYDRNTRRSSMAEAERSEFGPADGGESGDGNVGATVGKSKSPDHPASEVGNNLFPDVGVTGDVVVAVLLKAVKN